MEIQTIEVAGLNPAITAMRNPMDSWALSDSGSEIEIDKDIGIHVARFHVGTQDRNLSVRLQKAGPEHCKHTRMVQAWADITAPRYWLIEMDTYRAGVEKVSCSTMHKLMSRPLTFDDFENDGNFDVTLCYTISEINKKIKWYSSENDPDVKKAIWREIIQILPQSYLQRRTYMFSYAALRNIYRQREGHKLKEWEVFRNWCETLPESWMITE